jgi:hypothetical protein
LLLLLLLLDKTVQYFFIGASHGPQLIPYRYTTPSATSRLSSCV